MREEEEEGGSAERVGKSRRKGEGGRKYGFIDVRREGRVGERKRKRKKVRRGKEEG